MKRLICRVAMLAVAGPVFAADVAGCTLSADNKTVTMTATNPYSKVMALRGQLQHGGPERHRQGGLRQVPVGAKDFVMCTETATEGHPDTRVKGARLNYPDPSAPPPGSKAETVSKDDDAKADEKMQKMLKLGQQMLEPMKQKQK